MKKWLYRLPFLLGGVVAGVIAGLFMPVEWRAKLSQALRLVLGRMVALVAGWLTLTLKGKTVWRAPDTRTEHKGCQLTG